MPAARPYTGRFAPSPTGPLHAGSLVAALASWLDARAHQGRWLLRIEDVDTPRCVPGADQLILAQLARCGLLPDAPPRWQSRRGSAYQAALDTLQARGWAYPCACTRREIALALQAQGQTRQRFEDSVYPGTCRDGLHGRPARAQRLRVDRAPTSATATETDTTAAPSRAARGSPSRWADAGPAQPLAWHDRRLGPQQQDLVQAVGDFVLRRADGLWAYQLAVVVDDGDQGVTDIVRGEDLADNTARQIHLQRCLGLPLPRYLHTPLVRAADGHKLSKQNGAQPLDLREPLAALQAAGRVLGLPQALTRAPAGTPVPLADWLAAATRAWADRDVAEQGWAERGGADRSAAAATAASAGGRPAAD